MFLFTTHKKLYEQQIQVWASYQRRRSPFGIYVGEYEGYMHQFMRFIKKEDVYDVTEYDAEQFLAHIRATRHGAHPYEQARKAVGALMQFYAARGKRKESERLLAL